MTLASWAAAAPPRDCEACDTPFQPTHPRARYCRGTVNAHCPSIPRQGPKQRRNHATDVRPLFHGVIADVVMALQTEPDRPANGAALAGDVRGLLRCSRDPDGLYRQIVVVMATAARWAATLRTTRR